MKNVIKCLLLLATTLCCFSSIASVKRLTPVEEGVNKQVLHKGNASDPEDLDPQIVTGLPEANILLALFEGLVSMDPANLTPVPGSAESWDVSENGLIYNFHIRKDAKWSNGDSLTAQDFVFSYKRILSSKLAAPYAYNFYMVKGAEEYHQGKTSNFDLVGIRALNSKTLQITLKKPMAYFLSIVMHFSWYPLHPETLLKYGTIDQRGTAWTRGGNLVSNGPFKLHKWQISKELSVVRNPCYWDAKSVRLNEIHFYPMDVNTEERAFRAGQLHMTDALALPKVSTYKKKNPKELSITPFFSTYGFVFNTTKPPFNNPKVRHALSLALDRQSIVENITKGGQVPALSYIPSGTAGYEASASLHESVEEAKLLLAKAGYPGGKGFPKFELIYNTSDSHRSVCEALQYMWHKNLGINVELVNQEWKVYLKERKGNDFNMVRFGWVGDYIDPNAFLEVFKSGAGNNYAKWKNEEYDKILAQASSVIDLDARLKFYNKAEKILLEELPVLPLYYYTTVKLINPVVRNCYPNLLDLHPYKHVFLEK